MTEGRDKTRKPGKKPIPQSVKDKICRIVCTERPKDAAHWSIPMLAKEAGIGQTSVYRILRDAKLKPHLIRSFQVSTDPEFERKLTDVVGMYLNPPDNAIVLCVDEKSQIQALERSAPILPIMRNVPERQSHDYYRHGTAFNNR
jgi:hypothetical protein